MFAVLANEIRCIYPRSSLFMSWKGFESDQRRSTLLVIKMHLLVWHVVNKTLKFPLILLTINSPVMATFLILSCQLLTLDLLGR